MENEMTAFENNHLAIMANYALLETQIKTYKEQQTKLKTELEQAMEKFDIKSIDNDYLKITRVAPTTRTGLDLKAFEKEEPEEYAALLEDYPKITEVKASLRITVK